MFLVPLLVYWCGIEERRAFATSVAVIFPLSALSAVLYWMQGGLPLAAAWPYLLGGMLGGWIAGRIFHRAQHGVAAPRVRRFAAVWRRARRPAAMSALVAVAVGLATGILSGCGVGGGSLLMLYLTMLAGIGQYQAAGINLLYFLACAPAALWSHSKNGLIDDGRRPFGVSQQASQRRLPLRCWLRAWIPAGCGAHSAYSCCAWASKNVLPNGNEPSVPASRR